MGWIKMLHQDESHARGWGNIAEKLGESFQSSGGGSDSDDRK
jgi:hypothetical protein